jgi:hypothetical protein
MKAKHNKKKRKQTETVEEKKMQDRVQNEKWDRNFASIALNSLCPIISAFIEFKICPK